jgi:hypothetical protein
VRHTYPKRYYAGRQAAASVISIIMQNVSQMYSNVEKGANSIYQKLFRTEG